MGEVLAFPQVLVNNIKDIEPYDGVQFIIADCSVDDYLETWIKQNVNRFIEKGILVYYRICSPESYSHAQVTNLAMGLAMGDIVCYLRTSERINGAMTELINEAFLDEAGIFMASTPFRFHENNEEHPSGCLVGKLCLKKEHFIQVGGFDELMIKFGNEDIDLIKRLEHFGLSIRNIPVGSFSDTVRQHIGKGFSLYQYLNINCIVYILHRTPQISELLYLYKDGSYEKWLLYNKSIQGFDQYKSLFNKKNHRYKYEMKVQLFGKWFDKFNESKIYFSLNDELQFTLKSQYRNRYDVMINESDNSFFYRIEDPWLLEKLLLFNCIFYNEKVMNDNIINRRIKVNKDRCWNAALIRNFERYYIYSVSDTVKMEI